MNILFVVPNVPSPIRTRPFHFIRGLSRTHQVSVLCLSTNEADDDAAIQLRQLCHDLEVIRLPRWRSFWNCLRALFSWTPLRCAYFYSPQLREKIKERVAAGRVDLIHAEHLKSLAMVEPVLGNVPALFDAVDCLSMLEGRRRAITKNPLVKVFSWTESRKLSVSETKAALRFDHVAISSAIDRESYPVSRPALRDKIEVVPNGVDLEHFAFRQFQPQRNLVVFCAKLDYFPNEDAALYFAKSVWPRLRARKPKLRLQIVGSRPARNVRGLQGKDNIEVIPSVPDVRPYFGCAWIAVCPIRIRAGIQNKILEAMALGVPLVATSICCPGLEVEPGKHLLVADDPRQFASAIELLLENETLREKLILAGRQYVEQHHNWAQAIEALSNSYAHAVTEFNSVANSKSAVRNRVASVREQVGRLRGA